MKENSVLPEEIIYTSLYDTVFPFTFFGAFPSKDVKPIHYYLKSLIQPRQ